MDGPALACPARRQRAGKWELSYVQNKSLQAGALEVASWTGGSREPHSARQRPQSPSPERALGEATDAITRDKQHFYALCMPLAARETPNPAHFLRSRVLGSAQQWLLHADGCVRLLSWKFLFIKDISRGKPLRIAAATPVFFLERLLASVPRVGPAAAFPRLLLLHFI